MILYVNFFYQIINEFEGSAMRNFLHFHRYYFQIAFQITFPYGRAKKSPLLLSSNMKSLYFQGGLRAKRDGVIGHISKLENEDWINNLRYCAIDQSSIRRD